MMLPCPFCNGVAHLSAVAHEDRHKRQVICNACGGGTDIYCNAFDAVDAWNTRGGVPPADPAWKNVSHRKAKRKKMENEP